MAGRIRLALAARAEEVQHGVVLGGVAEVVAHDGLQHVVDEVLQRACAADDLGRLVGADVDDLRHVEIEGKAVARTHGDAAELGVKVVRLGAGGPVQHDVGGGHQLHAHDAGVDGVLAGEQGLAPHALVAHVHEVAVLEVRAADVQVRLAYIGDDHAHMADGDLKHGHLLDLGKPGVDVPLAAEQHLLLQAAAAAGVQEGLRVLKVVMPAHHRAGDLTGLDGHAVERGHDAHEIRVHMADAQQPGVQAMLGCVFRGDDGEERGIDAIRARCDDAELAAFFAPIFEEGAGVLEVIAHHGMRQDATRRNGCASLGHDEGQLSLRYADHGHFFNMVLHDPEAEMQARGQRVGLVAGLAMQGDDFSRGQVFEGKAFHDDAHLALRNVNAGDKVERKHAQD